MKKSNLLTSFLVILLSVGKAHGFEPARCDLLESLIDPDYISALLSPDPSSGHKLLNYLKLLEQVTHQDNSTGAVPRTDREQSYVQSKLFALIETFHEIDTSRSWEVGEAASDPELVKSLKREREVLEEKLKEFGSDALEKIYLSQVNPVRTMIIELHPDLRRKWNNQSDFIETLTGMYRDFAQKKGWSFEIINNPLNGASTSLRISGRGAYEALKEETGRHHLKTASQDVNVSVVSYGEVEQVPLQFKDSDFEIEAVRRSGGNGGQHANASHSTARIKHIPTGIEQEVSDERGLQDNLLKAKKLIIQKLDLTGNVNLAERRLYTNSTVTDKQLGITSDAHSVLRGNLDPFLDGYKKQDQDKALDDGIIHLRRLLETGH